jgi:hypothetical protein
MSVTRRKLRFAVMHADARLPNWAERCVERAVDSGHAELVLSIRELWQTRDAHSRPGGVLHRLYSKHWLARRSAALQLAEAAPPQSAPSRLECACGSDGALAAGDAESIRALGLDFILRFGQRPLSGAILEAARFGLWSFRHERQAAPFFWEILAGVPHTETELLRLSVDSQTNVSLARGAFGTCRASWVNSTDRALTGSVDFCARACAELVERTSLALPNAEDEAASLDASPSQIAPNARASTFREQAPSNRDVLTLLLRSGQHAVHKLWELLFHVEIWNVGTTGQTVAEIVRAARLREDGVRWCKPHRPGWFIADPFMCPTPTGEQLLVEEYGTDGKGRLCRVLDSDGSQYLQLAVELDEPHHLSYPSVFIDGGRTYCIPEAYQSRRVSLYERENGSWRLVRVLLDGEAYVDPTLFKHAGLYWLLYTLQNDGAWGNQKVYLQYSERLDGEFKPHLLNPVKCDIRSSRPAGMPVQIDGRLYRPSQDCSKTYGGAVVINELTKLSATEFEEIEVARIEPLRNSQYPDGLHTLNASEHGAVIDAKRFVFDVLAWRKNWGRLYEVFR